MLGIDDPITWMNATEPRVLDLWIAFLNSKSKEQSNMQPAGAVFEKMAQQWTGER